MYILPFNIQDVQFSLDKAVLEKSLSKEKGLPYNGILEVKIEDSLAEQLQNPFVPEKTYQRTIPSSYYEDAQRFLDNPPDWHKEDGTRIYIIFDKLQRCFWSPSGNNLNSFQTRSPERYLSQAIRVGLTDEQYVKLMGYFEWSCDNF